jgi:hypothetical protein
MCRPSAVTVRAEANDIAPHNDWDRPERERKRVLATSFYCSANCTVSVTQEADSKTRLPVPERRLLQAPLTCIINPALEAETDASEAKYNRSHNYWGKFCLPNKSMISYDVES